jgi:hypothetical protein
MANLDLTASLADSAVETPKAHTSVGEQVAKILQDGAAPPAGTPETGDSADQTQVETPETDALAETLKAQPDKFYSFKVKLPDDQGEVTIGELKDSFKATAALEKDRAAYLEARGNYEADRLRDQRELQALLGALPREVFTPQVIAMAQAAIAENASRTREAELRALPEWADSAIKAADRTAMAGWLKRFDLTPADLDGVADPRWQKALRAAARMADADRKRVEAEKPKPKVAVAPRPGRGQTESQQFGRLKTAVTKGQLSQTAAVDRILRGT